MREKGVTGTPAALPAGPVPEEEVVLVVDDQLVDRMVTEQIVAQQGRRVVTLDSGEAALDWLSDNAASLVLLDVDMPGLNGYDTARLIHEREAFQDLPILFLTASHCAEAFITHGFSVGACDYLTKPINARLLRNKVAIFLRLYQQQQSLARELERRRQAEEALRLSTIVFEHSPEAVMISDANNVIQTVNRAFEQTMGYTAAEAIGQTPRLLQSGRQDKAFYQQLWQTLKEDGQWQGEIWNRRKDGEVYPEWLSVVAVRDEQDEVVNYVSIFSDLSGRDQLRERLHQFAYYDPLTGLPNRQMLFDRLHQALARANREDEHLALVLLDIDHFKRINETLGHPVGDALLQAMAVRLLGLVRETDTLARMEGDVFALLIPGFNENEDAARMVQQLLAELERPLMLDGRDFHLSASAGIGVYPVDGETAEDLLMHADTALHRAKESGGNDTQFYTPAMSAGCAERLALESDLREAIAQKQLSLAYQPQISLIDGRMIGVEALARWQHPQHGHIPPDRFIAIAEDAGLIGALGEWALESACRQGVVWLASHDQSLRVAVNVSAHQLRDGGLDKTVERVLAETGLPAECLELELTESMLMEAVDDSMLVLQRLKALGIQLSIDDFGTGYSSLSYLKRFPIHKIKIDRSFVMDVPTDLNDVAIIEAIVVMAHRLKLEVVAEGVETGEQLEFLRGVGCNEIQGYLFSPPVPAEEITRMLNRKFVESETNSQRRVKA